MNTLRTATLVPTLWLAVAGWAHAAPSCLIWQEPELVMVTSARTDTVDIVAGIDGQGRAVVAYSESTDNPAGGGSTVDILYVRRHDERQGWAEVQELGRAVVAPGSSELALAVGTNGDALLSWLSFPPGYGNRQVLAFGYSPTSGWQVPYRFTDVPAHVPVVAVGPAGDGLLVYQDWKHAYAIKARSWSAARGYGAPQSVAQDWAYGFSVAVNASGQAVAVGSDGVEVTAARRSGRAGAWGAPQVLGTGVSSATPEIGVDLNAGGTAMATWVGGGAVLLRRFDPASGAWAEVETLEVPGAAAVRLPKVALNDAGQAELSWERANAAPVKRRYDELATRRYEPEQGWAATARIGLRNPPLGGHWTELAPDGASLLMWKSGKLSMMARSPTGQTYRSRLSIKPNLVATNDQGHALVLSLEGSRNPQGQHQLVAQRGLRSSDPAVCGR